MRTKALVFKRKLLKRGFDLKRVDFIDTQKHRKIRCFFIEQSYKPSSVFDDHLSRPYITIWFQPPPSMGMPSKLSPHKPIRCCFRRGLHSRCVTAALVSSYLTFPPSPKKRQSISVALSLESPPLGVTQRPAL